MKLPCLLPQGYTLAAEMPEELNGGSGGMLESPDTHDQASSGLPASTAPGELRSSPQLPPSNAGAQQSAFSADAMGM